MLLAKEAWGGGALSFVVTSPLALTYCFSRQGHEEHAFFPSNLGLMTAMPRFLHPSDYLMTGKKDGLLSLVLPIPWLWRINKAS